jgi:hypothetical protein
MTTSQPMSAEQALRMLRIVFGAIVSGLLVFAAVALLMLFADPETIPRVGFSSARLLVFSWTCLTVATALVAYRVARSVTEPLSGPGAAAQVADGTITLDRLKSRLILAAALTEGAAMYGIVVFALTGVIAVLGTSVAVAALGFALAFPRASWFAPFADSRPGETVIR